MPHKPRIAGFSFIKNAIKNDYPILEAIQSVLPLCDAFFIAVGRSEDETEALVRSLNDPKIHIIQTDWDENLRTGGRVLAAETDKAFDAIPPDFDWCIYIQGDEALHEDGHETLRHAMKEYLNDPKTQGFLLKYRHFYGSYDYIGISRKWYRREIRVIRNNKKIRSYRDAQGFRWANGQKLRVRELDAYVHHYGWVRHPEAQQNRQQSFNQLWHSEEKVKEMIGEAKTYRYDGSQPLERFSGRHPAVMQGRIAAMNWQFEQTSNGTGYRSLKDRILAFIEAKTGWRVGEYRNYKINY